MGFRVKVSGCGFRVSGFGSRNLKGDVALVDVNPRPERPLPLPVVDHSRDGQVDRPRTTHHLPMSIRDQSNHCHLLCLAIDINTTHHTPHSHVNPRPQRPLPLATFHFVSFSVLGVWVQDFGLRAWGRLEGPLVTSDRSEQTRCVRCDVG